MTSKEVIDLWWEGSGRSVMVVEEARSSGRLHVTEGWDNNPSPHSQLHQPLRSKQLLMASHRVEVPC